jgi:hypothetical protein
MPTAGRLALAFAAGLAGLASLWPAFSAPAAQPNFAPDDSTSWVPARPEGDEFIPPPSGPGPVGAELGHDYIPNNKGQPTYRIADTGNPMLQPWVAERLKKANDEVRAGKVPFVPHERCWPGGVPGWEVYTRVRPIYFIQTPRQVTIVDELNHEVRRVYMNVPHTKNPKPSWYGESVGRYVGDELVIDTIGQNDKSFVDNYQTPHSDKIHVVERFKLVEGGKILQATVTVDDPDAFKTSWSAVQRWRRGEVRPLEEDNCAENNFGFLNYVVVPIPQADKPDF